MCRLSSMVQKTLIVRFVFWNKMLSCTSAEKGPHCIGHQACNEEVKIIMACILVEAQMRAYLCHTFDAIEQASA